MTGAINYVRREGRYIMKYYLVAVILDLKYQIYSGRRCASVGRIYTQEEQEEYGGPHRTFYSNVKHGGIGVFIIFYSCLLLILHCSC